MSKQREEADRSTVRRVSVTPVEWLVYALMGLVAVAVPPFLSRLDLPILGRTDFDVFAGTASIALMAFGLWEWRKRRGMKWQRFVPLMALLLVAFASLQFIAEHSVKDWDYQCYEMAGQDVLLGRNPYDMGNTHSYGYLYPPVTAQTFGVAYGLVGAAAQLVGRGPTPEATWDLVFYLYQCGQLAMVCLLFVLCYRLGRRLGLEPAMAAGLVAALLLVNTPLHRTLKCNQINIWMLNMVIGGMLLVSARPVVAGFLVALAGHIKLYPLILLAPWALARRWTAVAASVVSVVVITLISTGGGRDWTLWGQWLPFFRALPTGTRVRDNSLHSLSWNVLLPAKRLLHLEDASHEMIVGVLTALLSAAVVVWFIWRFVQRERSAGGSSEMRLLSHSLDIWAATLLLSPLVWEHHYLFALPVVICAFALRRDRPWPVVLAATLMFALPTYHLYLLSYNRLAGLLLLLWATRAVRNDERHRRERGPASP